MIAIKDKIKKDNRFNVFIRTGQYKDRFVGNFIATKITMYTIDSKLRTFRRDKFRFEKVEE